MAKKDKARLLLGLDILLLSHELERVGEKDKRNDRSSELIKKAALFYINGGSQYMEMLSDIYHNALIEYQDWYSKNIYTEVMTNPVHIMEDGIKESIPKYDVNKYDIGKYFNGLNKNVFEGLQKLIFFLNHETSEEILNIFANNYKSKDKNFIVDSQNFFVLAQSILVATLEGGEFLERIEKIFSKYELSSKESKEINESLAEILNHDDVCVTLSKSLGSKSEIAKIAKSFLDNQINN